MTYSFKNCRECSKKHKGLNFAIQNSFTGTGNVTLHEVLGFDKELRRGSLKVEATKKLSWKNASKGGSVSFPKSRTTQNMMMAFQKTSGKGSPG